MMTSEVAESKFEKKLMRFLDSTLFRCLLTGALTYGAAYGILYLDSVFF